ncbi:MAG: hypothetical protein ACTSSA_11850 [Candidatus Freyarchaeota archaeon]
MRTAWSIGYNSFAPCPVSSVGADRPTSQLPSKRPVRFVEPRHSSPVNLKLVAFTHGKFLIPLVPTVGSLPAPNTPTAKPTASHTAAKTAQRPTRRTFSLISPASPS